MDFFKIRHSDRGFSFDRQHSRIWDPRVAMCWALSSPFCQVQTPPQILLIWVQGGRAGNKKNENGFLKLQGKLVIMKPIICVKFGILAVLDTSQ